MGRLGGVGSAGDRSRPWLGLAGEIAGTGAGGERTVARGRVDHYLDGAPASIGLGRVRAVGERVARGAEVRGDGFGDAAEFGCLAGVVR